MTPEEEADAVLAVTGVEELLQKFAHLTHRIHECKGSTVAGVCDGPCTEDRAMRDLIKNEILRRTGDLK